MISLLTTRTVLRCRIDEARREGRRGDVDSDPRLLDLAHQEEILLNLGGPILVPRNHEGPEGFVEPKVLDPEIERRVFEMHQVLLPWQDRAAAREAAERRLRARLHLHPVELERLARRVAHVELFRDLHLGTKRIDLDDLVPRVERGQVDEATVE